MKHRPRLIKWLVWLGLIVVVAEGATYKSLNAGNNNQFTATKGVTVKLPANLQSVFQETNLLQRKLKRLNIKPKVIERIEENRDLIRIVREVKFNIRDRKTFNKVFLVNPPKSMKRMKKRPSHLKGGKSTTVSLDALAKRVQKECRLGLIKDPMCKKGLKGIKQELAKKSGEYVVTEEVVFHKKPMLVDPKTLKIQLPAGKPLTAIKKPFKTALYPMSKKKKTDPKKFYDRLVKHNRLPADLKPASKAERIGPHAIDLRGCSGDVRRKAAKMLNGFTLGGEFSYSKSFKWKKGGRTIARTDLWAYLGMGFGVRLPYETMLIVNGKLCPEKNSAKVTAAFEAKNFGAAEYREVGVPGYQVFDGKEFVAKYGAEIGAKIEVGSVTLFNGSLGKKVDKSKDFTTPMGGKAQPIRDIVIHGKDIGLFYGDGKTYYLEGNIKLDFYLVGRNLYFKVKGIHSQPTTERVVFGKEEDEVRFSLEKVGYGVHPKEDGIGYYTNYGVGLYDPKYESDVRITTSLNLLGAVNTGKYLFGWVDVETPWLALFTYDVDIPELGAHSNTKSEIVIKGCKKYVKLKKESGTNHATSSSAASHTGGAGHQPANIGSRKIEPVKLPAKKLPKTKVDPKKIEKKGEPIPHGHF
jgi:hypothetical protein